MDHVNTCGKSPALSYSLLILISRIFRLRKCFSFCSFIIHRKESIEFLGFRSDGRSRPLFARDLRRELRRARLEGNRLDPERDGMLNPPLRVIPRFSGPDPADINNPERRITAGESGTELYTVSDPTYYNFMTRQIKRRLKQ